MHPTLVAAAMEKANSIDKTDSSRSPSLLQSIPYNWIRQLPLLCPSEKGLFVFAVDAEPSNFELATALPSKPTRIDAPNYYHAITE